MCVFFSLVKYLDNFLVAIEALWAFVSLGNVFVYIYKSVYKMPAWGPDLVRLTV